MTKEEILEAVNEEIQNTRDELNSALYEKDLVKNLLLTETRLYGKLYALEWVKEMLKQ